MPCGRRSHGIKKSASKFEVKPMIDKEKIKAKVKNGELTSKEGLQDLIREMTKEVLDTLYDGELEAHLGYKKNSKKPAGKSNSRNGYSSKRVKSQKGVIDLSVPRDRESTFAPQIIKKHETDISGIEDKVISMYAKGLSTRDIRDHIYDIYGHKISPETVSNITDLVIEKSKEWQNRPLEPIYAILFMDAIVVKLRIDAVVKNIPVYCILGYNLEGKKDILGLYVSESAESASYWLTVMNELKNRGLEDVLIFSVDNLTGISNAIETAFPKAEIQKCVVHQIRNSLKFVPWKERKNVAEDLRFIYTAATEEFAKDQLIVFEEKWGSKYPHISKSWKKNWTELATFFKYPEEVRKLIYTTNPIENFNRGLRKVSKNKGVFPTEDALVKLFYLAIRDMSKKWTMQRRDWGAIYSQLSIFFEERLSQYEN